MIEQFQHGAAGAGATACGLAARAWRAFVDALALTPAPAPPWARRVSGACDLLAHGWFALYSCGWFVVLTAAAVGALPSSASLGRRYVALALAFALLAMTRVFANTARDGWHRLRH